MDKCRDDTHLIDDQTYEKGLSKDPSPPYTEQANPQQGYNTQYSSTQPQHQQQYTQPGGYQQGYGCGYQQTNVMATQPYSGNPVIIRPVQRPNLLVYSVVVCLCCCWPIGIFAICFAAQANNAADRGDYEDSQSKAQVAKILIRISIALGIATMITVVVMFAVVGVKGERNHPDI